MNLTFKTLENLGLTELFQELGMSVYVASETNKYLEQVQVYQQQIYLKISEHITPNGQRTSDSENLAASE